MAGKQEGLSDFDPGSRDEWRAWLRAYHATAPSVWLVFHKKNSGKTGVSYDEAVEEALAFGWIDGRVNAVDNERYKQMFSPRKPRSTWARSNKERVQRLMEQGLMTEAGLAKVEAAKQDGSWEALDAVDSLTAPDDLLDALAQNPAAREHFQAFNSSTKKGIIWYIATAKRPETRRRRIEQIVAAAEQGLNPLPHPTRKRADTPDQ